MDMVIAQVVFETWRFVLLVFLCCASLIVALYCLCFMVPIRRFWARIGSLGGGMDGMKSHLEGVENEAARKMVDMEERVRQMIEESRNGLEERITKLGVLLQQVSQGLGSLEGKVESLASTLRDDSSNILDLKKDLSSAGGDIGQLRSDLEALDVKLTQSVQLLVSGSFQQIEGTILSALGAIQNEMLTGVARPDTVPDPRGGPRDRVRPDSRRRTHPRNIIPAEPLFSDLDRKTERKEKGDSGGQNQPKPGKPPKDTPQQQ